MATYTYETIPAEPGESVRQFELQQSMKEAPLTRHPETGEPIRRVITGGSGFISAGKAAPAASAPPRGGCGSGGCGCH